MDFPNVNILYVLCASLCPLRPENSSTQRLIICEGTLAQAFQDAEDTEKRRGNGGVKNLRQWQVYTRQSRQIPLPQRQKSYLVKTLIPS